MFEYLKELNETIYNRYLTVVKNIEYSSNSYFDSWLDLYEQLLKYILISEDIKFDGRSTCGQLLRLKETEQFLIEKLSFDSEDLYRTKSYITFVNDHKHNSEKKITIDDVFDSLSIFNLLSKRYAKYKNLKNISNLTIEYYSNLLGQSLRENEKLKKENNELKKYFADYKFNINIISDSEINKLSLEEQNKIHINQVMALKDIKLTSMETKLNKSIDLLLKLEDKLNKTIASTTICGKLIAGDIYQKKNIERLHEEPYCNLDAVKNNRIYSIPIGLTAFEQLSAMTPIFFYDQANKIYPEYFNFEIAPMVKETIKNYFGTELTDQQVEYMLDGLDSEGKPLV